MPAVAHAPPRPLRILYAEDDVLLRTMVAGVLRKHGPFPVDVTTCSDGIKALALVRAHREADQPFQLLLLDIEMKVMHGHDVALAVRREEADCGLQPVPIVFISGLLPADPRQQAALKQSAPTIYLDKRNYRDGLELGERLVAIIRSWFSFEDGAVIFKGAINL